MSLFFPRGYANPSDHLGHVGGIGSAVIVHGAIIALLVLGLGQAEKINEVAQPIVVRLVEAVRPEEKPPAPLPPKQQQRVQPRISKAPVLASAASSTSSNFVVQEEPALAIPAFVPATVPAAKTELLVEARFDADYLSNPKPPYPSASRRLSEAGTVYLRVHVAADGHAHKVELKTSSGFPRLDQSALDTVAAWRFVPAKRGSTTVASWVVVPIVFSLS